MKALYGRGPLHLAGHLALFALAGYALAQIAGIREAGYAFAWLIGAVLLHDLVLWPLYAGADRVAARGLRRPALNALRIPTGLSLVVGLAYLPVILEKGEDNYTRVSGLEWSGHLQRWLLLTAVLFAVSLLVHVARRYGSRT